MERARYYVGIDLGTTNSSVTLVDALALLRGDTDAAVRLLPVRQATARGAVESPYLPSVVAELQPRCWYVGHGAREARSRGLLRNRQIFYSTKLEMGLGREPFYPHAASPEYDSPYKVAGRIL
jgi:molecular chaperone DnaK (HSP70)